MNGDNYKAWETSQYTPKNFRSLDPRSQFIYLCQLGHLAPSTHNTQPWRFSIDEKNRKINVYLDKKTVLPASDVIGRQSVISIGCAIENILVGAEYYGLKTKLKILNNSSEPRYVLMAEIELTEQNITNNSAELLKSIFSRKVTRAEYDPTKKISEAILKELEAVTDGKTTKLHVIKDNVRKLAIAEFQSQADSFVINSSKFSRELGDWLLPNDTNSPLGMPGVGFGLQNDEALRLHRALSGQEPLQPEDGLRLALGGKLGIEKSSVVNIITIEKDDVHHWLEAGRAFERMFLLLDSKRISVAVHAAIVEVSLVNKFFAATLGTMRKIAVLFRAGWPKREIDKNRPHSPRLPIEKTLIDRF